MEDFHCYYPQFSLRPSLVGCLFVSRPEETFFRLLFRLSLPRKGENSLPTTICSICSGIKEKLTRETIFLLLSCVFISPHFLFSSSFLLFDRKKANEIVGTTERWKHAKQGWESPWAGRPYRLMIESQLSRHQLMMKNLILNRPGEGVVLAFDNASAHSIFRPL